MKYNWRVLSSGSLFLVLFDFFIERKKRNRTSNECLAKWKLGHYFTILLSIWLAVSYFFIILLAWLQKWNQMNCSRLSFFPTGRCTIFDYSSFFFAFFFRSLVSRLNFISFTRTLYEIFEHYKCEQYHVERLDEKQPTKFSWLFFQLIKNNNGIFFCFWILNQLQKLRTSDKYKEFSLFITHAHARAHASLVLIVKNVSKTQMAV